MPTDTAIPKSLEEARRIHREQGFGRYRGPRLEGPRTVLSIGTEGYPPQLENVEKAPRNLYVIGDPKALRECVAIVGARKATPYGLGCAETFARMSANKGVCVVSGGARGCDARAHQAALEEGGKTVVVLGGGCDEIYPAENFALFQRTIEQGGAVISEHPWDYPPLRHTFRLRNRLISGLAEVTLIVEAGLPSGAFATADYALSQGREVAVVPGAITSKSSRGCNRLIQQGAIPVVDKESFSDLLFMHYGRLKTEEDETPLDEWAKTDLGRVLSAQPQSLSEIAERIKSGEIEMEMPKAMETLARWRNEGNVSVFPDGRYGVAAR